VLSDCVSEPMTREEGVQAPILCYHRVVPNGMQDSVWTLGVSDFERQLQRLSARGYQTISLADSLYPETRPSGLPPKPIVLTFDDGDQGFFDLAAPVLARYDFRATLFVIAGELGKEVRLDGGPPFQVMSREAVAALAKNGFDIQSHGLHHPNWTQLGEVELKRELTESARILAEITGRSVRYLAYPYGQWTKRVRDIVESCGYLGACTTLPGRNTSETDRFLLKRTFMLNRKGRSALPWALYQASLVRNRIFGGGLAK
jgi:peptidoglycan/xylan/chitin deacetylase (PgdA/CDA1 family)